MFGSKHGNPNGKKPTIRRETVMVPIPSKPVPKGAPKPLPQKRSAAPPTDPSKARQQPVAKAPAPAVKKAQAPTQKLIVESRGLKRKSTTPERIQFSDDEDDSSDGFGNSDSDATSRKRQKSSISSLNSDRPSRNLVRETAFSEKTQVIKCMQGADATSGQYAAKFKNPWGADDFTTAELQYPSNTTREKFELKWPKNEKEDWRPFEDIKEAIKAICAFYLPNSLQQKYNKDFWDFRFNRAWNMQSIPEYLAIIEEYNDLVTPLVHDGTIRSQLALQRHLPSELIRRVLDQIYARTVSPKVETLRAYQNGSDNVYGELLPRFCSDIFNTTKLSQTQTFVDLGSGVGNVVLQAALEIGCDSWGIEMMPNPCDLADLQAQEFPTRTHLWGLDVGDVHLLRGDFTNNPTIGEVLRKADVVLVNNQAFTPALNDSLLHMFLDLKDGAKVVSLKPFIAEGHRVTSRNYGSPSGAFVQQKPFTYFSGCVSWTDQQGQWYIMTKDSGPLNEYRRRNPSL